MTTFILVRHGAHDRLNRFLDGRRPGVHLNDLGRRQAEWAAGRLADLAVDAVYTSPLDRTRETAAVIGRRLGLEPTVEPALEELDFGSWSGRTIAELEPLEDWRQWNEARAISPTPSGDTMRAAQGRILDFIDDLRRDHPDGCFVLVGHSDPLKAALFFYLGLSLDKLHRIAVAPGSLNRVEIDGWGATVVGLNETMPE